MSQECENRCIFAMLVVMCVTKQIDGFLSGLDAEDRDFFAQIWDSHCITPSRRIVSTTKLQRKNEKRNSNL